MCVIHEQPLNRVIVQVSFHRRSHCRDGCLVKNFVSLNINALITCALLQSDVCVLRKNSAGVAQIIVPIRFDDTNFRIADRSHGFERAVGGVRHVDDNLITQRQQRPYGFEKRIAQNISISDKRKTTNFHRQPFLMILTVHVTNTIFGNT